MFLRTVTLRPSIVPTGAECVTDDPGKLTPDQDMHKHFVFGEFSPGWRHPFSLEIRSVFPFSVSFHRGREIDMSKILDFFDTSQGYVDPLNMAGLSSRSRLRRGSFVAYRRSPL